MTRYAPTFIYIYHTVVVVEIFLARTATRSSHAMSHTQTLEFNDPCSVSAGLLNSKCEWQRYLVMESSFLVQPRCFYVKILVEKNVQESWNVSISHLSVYLNLEQLSQQQVSPRTHTHTRSYAGLLSDHDEDATSMRCGVERRQ